MARTPVSESRRRIVWGTLERPAFVVDVTRRTLPDGSRHCRLLGVLTRIVIDGVETPVVELELSVSRVLR